MLVEIISMEILALTFEVAHDIGQLKCQCRSDFGTRLLISRDMT